jgi:fatty acid desaturase
VATGELVFAAKIAVMLPLTILAGYGLNMLGFVGHEGMHGSLFRNRTASAVVGLFTSAAVVTYFELGFAMSHWNHHRFTNQADDPDILPVRKLKTWWQRLLFSRLIYNTLYFKHTLNRALGRPIPFKYKMPYSPRQQTWFAWLNFLFASIWISGYVAVAIRDWRAGLYAVLVPFIAVNFIGAMQIYLDHAGLGDRFFENARSRTSWGMTALFFGANYHLEHHAYPGVPCYRLPALHRLLVSKGVYAQVQAAHDPNFFGVFRSVALPYVVSSAGTDFDPFEHAAALERTTPTLPSCEVVVLPNNS